MLAWLLALANAANRNLPTGAGLGSRLEHHFNINSSVFPERSLGWAETSDANAGYLTEEEGNRIQVASVLTSPPV